MKREKVTFVCRNFCRGNVKKWREKVRVRVRVCVREREREREKVEIINKKRNVKEILEVRKVKERGPRKARRER